MIFEIKQSKEAERLFEGWQETIWLNGVKRICIDKIMDEPVGNTIFRPVHPWRGNITENKSVPKSCIKQCLRQYSAVYSFSTYAGNR